MYFKHTLFYAGLTALSSVWLHAEIEFVGVSTEKTEIKIGLVETSNGVAKWLKPGDQFVGYTLVGYDTEAKTASLTKDGAELRIKLKEPEVVASPKEAEPQPSATTTNPSEYIIKPGDVPSRIAQNAGITLADLQALNPGVNWSKLHVGQKIHVK